MNKQVASLLTVAVFLFTAWTATAQSAFKGLPEAVSEEAKKCAVVFDFDTDSCYPAPAVSKEGTMNGGLKDSGSLTGECRQMEQFTNANTYCRSAAIDKGGVKYRVFMYALYFEKDQAVSNTHFGHRHDWEYALVWTKDAKVTHASFSAHGGLSTKAKSDLNFDAGEPDTVKVVYHKDGVLTHCFRPAKKDEKAENDFRKWVTPTLVEWDRMKSDVVSNEDLRKKFNEHSFGEANCSFNDNNFPNEIAKNPPPGYPGGDEWKQAGAAPKPKTEATPVGDPEVIVASWLVLPGRDADRDNRLVDLRPGQRARIVVRLPEGPREKFRFNLKHDKKRDTDRGRTPRIGHGDVVSGDAHDWPSFGTRIYLGERNDSDSDGFRVAPNGFTVDLVLVK